MPLAVFRADAGAAIGAGHAMRCLALADAFEAAHWSVAFASSAETFGSIDPLQAIPGERLVVPAGEHDEPDALQQRWPNGVDALIVDHYGRDSSFERRCRPWARRILVIDDLANREHDSDVVVDASASAPDSYVGLVPHRSRVLVGPKYAIVHSKFGPFRNAAMALRANQAVRCILISFGQNDAPNATGETLAALDDIGFSGTAHVVLGATAPHLAQVRARTIGNRQLHVNSSDMHRLMQESDLAVGAAGATAWERCFLALPSILVLLSENQSGNVATIVKAGAGVDAGRVDEGLRGRLASMLRELLDDGARLTALGAAGAALIDGRGKERILSAMAGR